jgi:thioredoxin 1
VSKSNIKNFTEESFDGDIKKGVVLVDFYADWCGPCRMMTPVLEKVADESRDKAVIAKIDIDSAQKVAGHFQVTSVPTLILFKDGKEMGRLVGLRDAETVKDFISSAV